MKKEILLLTLLYSANGVGEVSINIGKSSYNITQHKYDERELTFNDQYNEDSYWSNTYQREYVIKSIVSCILNDCTTADYSDISEIHQRSIAEFGEAEGQTYFSNVIAGLVIAADTEEDRKEVLNSAKDYMSFNQKIYTGHMIGHIMSRHYDYDRDPDGIVSKDEIYNAIREGNDAGVCRDIAVAQAKILKDLDINNVYVLAYTTQNSGHAIVVAQDPNDSNKIVSLNYGEVRTNQVQNAQGLDQSSSIADFGISYRIYNSDGSPHDSISTELGFILNKVLGFDNELSSPGAKYDGINYNSFDYKKGTFKATAFYSDTDLGLKTYGAGASFRDSTKYTRVNMGVSGYKTKKTIEHRDFQSESMGIFAGIEVQLRTGKINFGKLKNIYADTKFLSTASRGSGIYSEVGTDSSLEEINNEGEGFFSTHHKMSSSVYGEGEFFNINWEGIITAHAALMKKDIRDESSTGFRYQGTTIKNSFSKELFKGYTMSFENTIYVKQHGSTTDFNIAVHSPDDRYSLKIGKQLPVSGDSGFWMIGHEKESYLKLQAKTRNNNFTLGLRVAKSETLETYYELQTRVRF